MYVTRLTNVLTPYRKFYNTSLKIYLKGKENLIVERETSIKTEETKSKW